jgi:2,4-dienoyl-CoA reductase-like NADH-dependent reductase (Old Yellow Enzyme family)
VNDKNSAEKATTVTTTPTNTAFSQAIILPCGATLTNRLVKASMSEGIADHDNRATERMATLYRRWSHSGAGLLLSGNFQIDKEHLERPYNVVVDEQDLDGLRRVAQAGSSHGAPFWAQLSHTGRLVSSAINSAPLAPSAVELEVPASLGRSYAKPRAMSEAQIAHAISQFAAAAGVVKKAGFNGIHVHGAHGYLISQFLSGRSNVRADEWGGTLRNRARFLLEVITAIRAAVGAAFPIGLKLNSSDFMKGGFTNDDALEVVGWLNDTSLDLLELSGGSVEQPKSFGITFKDEGQDARPESTIKREAYFVDFAARIRKVAKMPVMVTGGFRTAKAMNDALSAGDVDLVGLGRPFCADPDIAAKLLSGEVDQAPRLEGSMAPFLVLPWCNIQIERMADGLEPDLTMTGEDAAARFKALEAGYLKAWQARNTAKPTSASPIV